MRRAFQAAYVGVAAVDTFLSASHRPRAHGLRRITKPLLMPLLAASLATAPGERPLRRPVLAAQAAGWVGDVALLSERRGPFLVGSSAFGVGHLAYLAGFTRHARGDRRLAQDPRARAIAATWAATVPVVAWRARAEGVAPVVVGYSALLTAMTVAANRLDPAATGSASGLIGAGGLLFLASDSTLALRKFVLDDPSPLVEGAVMATYTAAQALLSEGAARYR